MVYEAPYNTHQTASGRLYLVVARTDVRRSSHGRVISRGGSEGSGGGGGNDERFAKVGTVRVEAIVGRGVAGVQAQRALVHILAGGGAWRAFGLFVEVGGVVARPETGRASRRATVTALRVQTTLAYPASRYPIGTFVDICHRHAINSFAALTLDDGTTRGDDVSIIRRKRKREKGIARLPMQRRDFPSRK